MTPLASWIVIAGAAILGAILTYMIVVAVDDSAQREWERGMQDWQAMCDALDLEDADPPTNVADQRPHRGH